MTSASKPDTFEITTREDGSTSTIRLRTFTADDGNEVTFGASTDFTDEEQDAYYAFALSQYNRHHP